MPPLDVLAHVPRDSTMPAPELLVMIPITLMTCLQVLPSDSTGQVQLAVSEHAFETFVALGPVLLTSHKSWLIRCCWQGHMLIGYAVQLPSHPR